MKILFAVHGYKPAWRLGGPVISVPALAEALVKRGHELAVFTTNSNQDQDLDVPTDRWLDVDGVRVRYFRRSEPLKRWFPSIKYLSQSGGTLYAPDMPGELARVVPSVDLVHTHLPFIYPTLASARAAFRHGKPLFYHQRGVFDPERLKFRALKKSLYLSLIEKPILRRATMLVALTPAEQASYAALGIRTPSRVIPNGIDLPPVVETAAMHAMAAEWGIRPDHLVVLFLARLHPVKGADRLLEAFLRVAGRHPNAVLMLAGPDEFGIEASFRQRVSDAGLGARVVFPGMVSGERKAALLQRADLFSLPSDAEGFSMAVLEALAHRTAVLLSPGCHFPEVEAAGCGVVAEPNADALETALDGLLARPGALRDMGALGRALVSRDYTWDVIAARMEDAYAEGVDRHRRARPSLP